MSEQLGGLPTVPNSMFGAADLRIVLGIAGMEGELRGRRFHQLLDHRGIKAHALAIEMSAPAFFSRSRASGRLKSMPISDSTFSEAR